MNNKAKTYLLTFIMSAYLNSAYATTWEADTDDDEVNESVHICTIDSINSEVGVCVEEAGSGEIREYSDSWSSASVFDDGGISDTDVERQGNEIVVLRRDAGGLGISTISDTTGQMRHHDFPQASIVSPFAVRDTDGVLGKEIIFRTVDEVTFDENVVVINQSTGNTSEYSSSNWGNTTSIYDAVDTDGLPGDEVVVVFQNDTLEKVGVTVLEGSGSLVDYTYPFFTSATIMGSYDYDTEYGKELCVRLVDPDANVEYKIIKDSNGQSIDVEDCNITEMTPTELPNIPGDDGSSDDGGRTGNKSLLIPILDLILS